MRGFTLIELIFVIIIFGILSMVSLEYLPDNTLIKDYEILEQKILQKKYTALGYKYYGINEGTCIKFDKDWLNKDVLVENKKEKHFFKSNIYTNGAEQICFDYLGRVYKDSVDVELKNLLHKPLVITLEYQNKDRNITIYPYTGAIK